eukprot:4634344-Prymnesium_polylepis.1
MKAGGEGRLQSRPSPQRPPLFPRGFPRAVSETQPRMFRGIRVVSFEHEFVFEHPGLCVRTRNIEKRTRNLDFGALSAI